MHLCTVLENKKTFTVGEVDYINSVLEGLKSEEVRCPIRMEFRETTLSRLTRFFSGLFCCSPREPIGRIGVKK